MTSKPGRDSPAFEESEFNPQANPWRIAGWSAIAVLLLLPAVAMQITDEVHWTFGDFTAAAVLLVGAGLAIEVALRQSEPKSYRAAAVLAILAMLLLIWINLAVGIIGAEENPANLLYFMVLGVGLVGAFSARFRARGMAVALLATTGAQAVVAAIVLIAGLTYTNADAVDLLLLNGFFVSLFAGSALLFSRAARDLGDINRH